MNIERFWKGIVTLVATLAMFSGFVYANGVEDKKVEAPKPEHGGKALAVPAKDDRVAAPADAGHEEPQKKPKHVKSAKSHGSHKAAAHDDDSGVGLSAEDALNKLIQGNKRYVAGKPLHPNSTAKRRVQVAKGQHPFAIIVSCSDSRVPPEVLFDQGLGDLFVVRSAGHVVGEYALGSIEYAVEHLGVKLIVVLGHERCGAVEASVKGGEVPGHIKEVVEAIRPAVEKVRGKHGDILCNAVKSNVKLVAEKIKKSGPILAEPIEDGVLKVVGAYYGLDTGAVEVTYKPGS